MIFDEMHVEGSKEGQKCRMPLSGFAPPAGCSQTAKNCNSFCKLFFAQYVSVQNYLLKEIFLFNTIFDRNTTAVLPGVYFA